MAELVACQRPSPPADRRHRELVAEAAAAVAGRSCCSPSPSDAADAGGAPPDAGAAIHRRMGWAAAAPEGGCSGFCPHAAGTGTGIDAGRGRDTDRGSWRGVRREEVAAVCRRRLGLGAVAVAEAGRAPGS